jgi:hypothetical protein
MPTVRRVTVHVPGIDMPMLTVMGRVGAVGKMNFTWGTSNWGATAAQPFPVSPRPCSIISVAVCAFLGEWVRIGPYTDLERGRVRWMVHSSYMARIADFVGAELQKWMWPLPF